MINPLTRKQVAAIAVIIGAGMLCTLLILNTHPSGKSNGGKKPSAEQATPSTQARPVTAETGKANSQPSTTNTIVLSETQIQAAGIQIDTARAAPVKNVQSLPGEIHFNEDKTARIVPRLGGVVESVSVSLGQPVKKGQVLATIASPAIADLRSELNTALQRLALAQTTYDREKMLWQEKISATQDYLQAKQMLNEAQITVQNVQQKLHVLGATSNASSINRYDIRAPFDGMVTDKRITLGDAVKEDTPLFQISDLSSVWADITVPASSLHLVQVGDAVVVKATQIPSTAFGKISYISALMGEQTRTATARVTLANPGLQWRPGLFVTVDITTSETAAPVTVAADAIQDMDGKPTVFVHTKEGFQARPVVVDRTDGARTAIRGGIAVGAKYAAKNSFVLKAELSKASAQDND